MIGSDGRSRAWLNGQTVPLQLLRERRRAAVRHPRPARIPVADARQRAARTARQLRPARAAGQPGARRARRLAGADEPQRRARDRGARPRRAPRPAALPGAGTGRAAAEAPARSTAWPRNAARLGNRGRLVEAARPALDGAVRSRRRQRPRSCWRARSQRPAGRCRRSTRSSAAAAAAGGGRASASRRSRTRWRTTCDIAGPRRARARTTIERRLAAIEELARKHRVPAAELPERLHGAWQPSWPAWRIAASRPRHPARASRQRADALPRAGADSCRRRAARPRAPAGAATSSARMQELGMAGGRFVVEVTPLDRRRAAAARHRPDRVPRHRPIPASRRAPLAKVASGGELARLSLAVQVACAARRSAPCMVFDEVDAGIGGAVAEIVGRELRALGARRPGAVRDAPAAGGRPRATSTCAWRSSPTAAPRAPASRRSTGDARVRGTRAHAGRHREVTRTRACAASRAARCWNARGSARRRRRPGDRHGQRQLPPPAAGDLSGARSVLSRQRAAPCATGSPCAGSGRRGPAHGPGSRSRAAWQSTPGAPRCPCR